MASAWGYSWGAAWGNSWGSIAEPEVAGVRGGKGDNTKKRRALIKPTGLVYRDENKQAIKQALVITPQQPEQEYQPPVITVKQVTDDGVPMQPHLRISQMSNLDMASELKFLIDKEFRTDEEEALMLIFMEAI